jgi:hypothetical protein
LSTVGLGALASFHTTMITSLGGADTVVCSTGYGGSDKLGTKYKNKNYSRALNF